MEGENKMRVEEEIIREENMELTENEGGQVCKKKTQLKPNLSEESNQGVSNDETRDLTKNKSGRLGRLTDAIDKTVKHCISAASFALLAKNVPLKKSANSEVLKKCHNKFKDKIAQSVKLEVAKMLDEESIPKFLSELDELSKMSKSKCMHSSGKQDKKTAWRPTGVPADDVAAHLMQPYLKYKQELEVMLAQEEEKHEKLRCDIAERRHLIASRLKLVKVKNANLQQLVSQCSPVIQNHLEPTSSQLLLS